MPIYTFHCPACSRDFDLLRPLTRAGAPASCSSCGAEAQPRPAAFAVHSTGFNRSLSSASIRGGDGVEVERPLSRAELQARLDRFFDAWARHDLDAAMAMMSDDCLYDEFNANLARGRAAVRAAFLPNFRGDYGDIQFHLEDSFIDEQRQEALARWLCVYQWQGRERRWRGLDILRFRNGQIVEKLTYAKTPRPLTKEEQRTEA